MRQRRADLFDRVNFCDGRIQHSLADLLAQRSKDRPNFRQAPSAQKPAEHESGQADAAAKVGAIACAIKARTLTRAAARNFQLVELFRSIRLFPLKEPSVGTHYCKGMNGLLTLS